DLLTTASWQGADLEGVGIQQLGPFASQPGRLAVEGESVALAPRAALTLSMVLHELATNAAKYGALSAPEGRLQVRWTVGRRDADAGQAADRVTLTWQESGGPPGGARQRGGVGARLVGARTNAVAGGGARACVLAGQ